MTLVELIRALKEELKHGGGDRELRPDVTVAAILDGSAPPGGIPGQGRPWSVGLAPAAHESAHDASQRIYTEIVADAPVGPVHYNADGVAIGQEVVLPPAPSAWDDKRAAEAGDLGNGIVGQAELPPADPPTRRRRANG